MYIYLITNHINGKQYVGQTIQSLHDRFAQHAKKASVKGNMILPLAIQKYGKTNFSIQLLKICYSLEEMNYFERYFADRLKTWASDRGYNLRVGNGKGAMSEEAKQILRNYKPTPETLQRLSTSHLGIRPNAETRHKLSLVHKGKQYGPLTRKRIGASNAKKIFTFISPTGEIITFNNLNEFCRTNGLRAPKMCLLNQGKRRQYKGWKRFISVP